MSSRHNTQKEYFDYLNLKKRIHSPKVDLFEMETHFMIRIELPGVDNNSIKVNIKDNQIVFISGNKLENNIEEKHRIVYKEAKYNDFTRRVKLPAIVKPFDNTSIFNNGVLTLQFYKVTPTTIDTNEKTNENTNGNTNGNTNEKTNENTAWCDEPI